MVLRRSQTIFLLAIVASVSCQSAFKLEVSGTLRDGVVFSPSRYGPGPKSVSLERLVVVDDSGREMWRLAGKGEVRTIQYGIAPQGFSAVVGASPLRRASKYRVRAAVSAGWIASSAVQECQFEITSDGVVVAGRGCGGSEDRERPQTGEREDGPTSDAN